MIHFSEIEKNHFTGNVYEAIEMIIFFCCWGEVFIHLIWMVQVKKDDWIVKISSSSFVFSSIFFVLLNI